MKLKKCTIINVSSNKLNGSCIDLVTEYKYLGVIMCTSSKDVEAIGGQIHSLYSRGENSYQEFLQLQ